MKKILFLMAILPMMLFTACSSDDNSTNDYESQLVGTWSEDTNATIEVLNLELKADHTGLFWATNDGKIDSRGKRALTWSATENKFTEKQENGDIETFDYQIKNGKLYLGEIVYAKKQIKRD